MRLALLFIVACGSASPHPKKTRADDKQELVPTVWPPQEGCFGGNWRGGADDVDGKHWSFRLVLLQEGDQLRGHFEQFSVGEVTGVADCATLTASLQSGNARFRITLHPHPDPNSAFFDGTWDCGPDCGGALKAFAEVPVSE